MVLTDKDFMKTALFNAADMASNTTSDGTALGRIARIMLIGAAGGPVEEDSGPRCQLCGVG